MTIKSINFWLQFLLWLFYYYTVVYHFIEWLPTVGMFLSTSKIYIYSFIYLILVAFFPYLNSYYLLQRYFRSGKKIYYYIILTIGVCLTLVCFVLLDYVFAYPNIPTWFFIPLHFLSRLPYILLFIIVIYLFKIRSEFYEQQGKQLILEKEKSEAELQFLKAQINPHFLFNTLNNIQSLSFTNPQKASETIVNLSNLFRYISYEGKRDKVKLQDEIDYIKNYLKLSVMKKSWLDKVVLNIGQSNSDILIEPLLLINFIENAFKHGSLEEDDDFIKISIETINRELVFCCANTFIINSKPSGLIGLDNVKKRLELVYPNKYYLDTNIKDNVYKVKLTIQYAN
jgi:two-component system LytT family sensor kinase